MLIDAVQAVLDRDKISLILAGDLLEESQSEASRLRQRVEELVRDNEALKSSSFAASLCTGGPAQTETQSRSNRLDCNHVDIFCISLSVGNVWHVVLLYCHFYYHLLLVLFISGKPCLHPTAEEKEEQTSCLGKTLQPEKPNVWHLYRQKQL